MIRINQTKAGVSTNEMDAWKEKAIAANRALHEGTGKGADYLGWVNLPETMDPAILKAVEEAAKRIQAQSEVLVVIGIGGSYLGSKAAIETLNHSFYNLQSNEDRRGPVVLFAGHQISGRYTKQLIDWIGEKDFSVNVISKSGTTTEPAIAFRALKKILEERYGKDGARERIYVTTDEKRGALRTLADQEGYTSFVIPDVVGGRYSIFTPVGLLPIAATGVSIAEMMAGAKKAQEDCALEEIEKNPALQYAILRNCLLADGKTIEILANYEPSLHFIAEWWKQLYGESEGKDGLGIFPSSVDFSTDLHSMGQYIQDGPRNLFETVLHLASIEEDLVIEEDEQNLDQLNYLAGKTFAEVNQSAFEGTLLAHVDGGVPNIIIEMEKMDPETFGYLIYFFEKACGISGYLLGVNPFDQPGVEAYKRNMFALLGKAGYEELARQLKSR
ncbi:glucose-6-phosphate isomerase [Gottschalkiaceae bacterium SANA]|nr:glucose-6-phosphate isomerase [Gottschalkiaceae bacterium SANA]